MKYLSTKLYITNKTDTNISHLSVCTIPQRLWLLFYSLLLFSSFSSSSQAFACFKSGALPEEVTPVVISGSLHLHQFWPQDPEPWIAFSLLRAGFYLNNLHPFESWNSSETPTPPQPTKSKSSLANTTVSIVSMSVVSEYTVSVSSFSSNSILQTVIGNKQFCYYLLT